MNEQEVAQANEALNVLRTFPVISKLHIAASHYFGETQYRRTNNESTILCIPDNVKATAKSRMIEEKIFSRDTVEPDYLRVAFMLDSDDQTIMDAVGKTAFHPEGVYFFTGDARPLARIVLSKYSSQSAKWSDQALVEISSKDKLGTSAAAVAASAGNLKAIKKISHLINEIIEASGQKAIKYEDTKTLYQLVVALALGGERAQQHISPLITLLNHKIESWAPPFGMIEVSPNYVCAALEKIGGTQAESVLQRAPCIPEK